MSFGLEGPISGDGHISVTLQKANSAAALAARLEGSRPSQDGALYVDIPSSYVTRPKLNATRGHA